MSCFDHADLTDVELLDRIATIVSRAAATIFAVDPASAAWRAKPDQSPVTEADERSNQIIMEQLSRLLPGLPIVSEESKPLPATLGRYFALVDPLDGTREFLAGRDEFTVNVALVRDGLPTLGVIAAPAQRTMWRGLVGYGAERLMLEPGQDMGKATQKVAISTRARPDAGLIATVSRSHFDRKTAKLMAHLPIVAQSPCGSSLKFCRVAEGQADIYPRLSPTREWDIAAGHAILAAAGGTVLSPDGERLSYGAVVSEFLVPAFVALGDPRSRSLLFN